MRPISAHWLPAPSDSGTTFGTTFRRWTADYSRGFNPNIVTAQILILHGDDMELTRLWLNALAVDVTIPEKASKEIYHDVTEEIAGMWRKEFPILRDDGEGNIYYRVYRRIPGTVRIVETARMKNLPTVPNQPEHDSLRAYVRAIDAIPAVGDRLQIERPNTDQMGLKVYRSLGNPFYLRKLSIPDGTGTPAINRFRSKRTRTGFMLAASGARNTTDHVAVELAAEIRIGLFLSLLSVIIAGVLIARRTPVVP